MKITKRQLRRIIKESMNWTPKEKESYNEGLEQGQHDAVEQMGQGEVLRHLFDSQEEYEAFVRGYDDGYQGTMDVLPSRYHENRIKKEKARLLQRIEEEKERITLMGDEDDFDTTEFTDGRHPTWECEVLKGTFGKDDEQDS